MHDQDTFEHKGLTFRVHIEQDNDADAPWDREEGHGPVRYAARTRNKRPGERVLHCDGHGFLLYDWQAAAKMARKDGWNAPPYDAPHRIQRAVQADFDRLRRWLNDDWWYVGVCVTVEGDLDADKYAHALWGIESDCTEYISEVAHELARECGNEYLARIAKLDEEGAKAAALATSAARYEKLKRLIQHKDLGTSADPDTGRLKYPLYRRWFIDTEDLNALDFDAVIDSMEEPQ